MRRRIEVTHANTDACGGSKNDRLTGSDSNFYAEHRRFYVLPRVSRPLPDARRTLGGYSVLQRAVGGIWRAAPGDDENYVYTIALL